MASSLESVLEISVLSQSNLQYDVKQTSSVFEFPGLVKNPLWLFSQVLVNISCQPANPSSNLLRYFVSDSNTSVCQQPNRLSWISHYNSSLEIPVFSFAKSFLVINEPNHYESCSVSFHVQSKPLNFLLSIFCIAWSATAASEQR